MKNAGDGMAMTRTIESALNTISDIQRMRELAVNLLTQRTHLEIVPFAARGQSADSGN